MPTYREPTKDEADLLALVNKSPADFLVDENGEAVPRSSVDTWTGAAWEGAKGAVRGVRDMVGTAVEFPGTVADMLRERTGAGGVQLVPGTDESVFTVAGKGIRKAGDSVLAPGDNLDVKTKARIASKLGTVLGSVAGLAGPGLATKGASAAAQYIPVAMAMLSGAQDVSDRAEATGLPKSEAAEQGLKYLPIAYAENALLARYGPQAAGFLGNRVKNSTALKEVVQGAAGSGADEVTQQLTAREDLNVEQALEAAALGGVAQGAIAKLGGVGRKPAEEQAPVADVEKSPEAPVEVVADTALEARIAARLDAQARGEKYETIKPSPVDEAFQEAQRRKIPMDEDMLRSLEEIYAGNDSNKNKVFEAARLLLDQGRVARPAKTQPTPEMVEAQQAELAKLDAQMDKVEARRKTIIEQQSKRAEELMKNPPAADSGDAWMKMAQERANTESGELALLEQQFSQLLEQRKLLTQSGNVTPEGGPQQIAEGEFKRKYFPGAVISKTPWDINTVGQGELGSAVGDLAGQTVGARFDLPEKLPPTETAKVAPQEPFSTKPSASEYAAREAILRAKLNEPARESAEPTAVGGREATRPRERGPRGQQERDLIQAELDAIEAERTGVPVKKVIEQRRAKEIEAFMRGETLPGMEGEQGRPFSGASEVYGTLVPPSLIESVRKVAKEKGWRAADPLRLLHLAIEERLGRLAKRGPLHAYLASKVERLFTLRDQLRNRKQAEFDALAKKHKSVVEDPRWIEWKHQTHTERQADYNQLPAELRAGAKEIDAFLQSFQNEQNERGIAVWELLENGKREPRPAQHIEGFGIYKVSPEVYLAMEEGGAKWKQFEQDWMDNWVSHKGSDAGAAAALQAFRGAVARSKATGGEPLFSAVRNQAGVPLPKSWRSKDFHDSISNYIDLWAKDIGWAEVAQKDPLVRRALGIQYDAAGNKTVETDIAYKPTKPEWDLMLDRGSRADASWVKGATPDMSLGQPLAGNDPAGVDLLASYTQAPITRSKGGRAFEVGNQIAGTMMMQHFSKLRNIAQSGITVLDYALSREAPKVFSALADSVIHPMEAILKAEKGGAVSVDVMRHEFADALAGGMNTVLRNFRKYAGINGLDAYAKALAYNVAEAAVKAQVKRLGAKAPLLREFSNFDMLSKGADINTLVTEAAATIANHVDPQFDVRSLPGGMIPQNRQFVGNMLRLMTWSIGRYNHWYKDAYLPAVRDGNYDRLLKSIFVGAIGAAATQELLSWLQNKMPRDLSLGEWFRLDDEQKKQEFAPMLFGYLQAQGSMGVLGDILYAGARVQAGRPITQDYSRPMVPLVLVGTDLGGILWDFQDYATTEKGGWQNLDATDLMSLGVELAKLNQSARSILGRGDDWLPERLKTQADEAKLKREERVFEETTGRSALTGKLRSPITATGQAKSVFPAPFSLNKEFNLREGEDLDKLLPIAEQAARRGITFRTDSGRMSPAFYNDVIIRRGEAVADQIIGLIEQKESERRRKRPLARALNRLGRNRVED